VGTFLPSRSETMKKLNKSNFFKDLYYKILDITIIHLLVRIMTLNLGYLGMQPQGGGIDSTKIPASIF
jgi:hypothetical protein